jgi:hypothetical protein
MDLVRHFFKPGLRLKIFPDIADGLGYPVVVDLFLLFHVIDFYVTKLFRNVQPVNPVIAVFAD